SSLSATAVSPNRINLSWGASTDSGGSGLAGYRIIRNGTLLPSVVPASTRTFSDTNLAGNTKYTYQVYAYDNANNSSTPTAGVSAITPPEIPAPPTGISGPIENYSGSY